MHAVLARKLLLLMICWQQEVTVDFIITAITDIYLAVDCISHKYPTASRILFD